MEFKNIYIVHDDELVCISTEAVLKAEGYNTTIFSSGEDFLDAADELEPGCVLLDVKMEGMGGLEVLKEFQSRMKQRPVIMMSGHGDISMALQAIRLGAVDFIEKPFTFDVILEAIKNAGEYKVSDVQRQPESRSVIDDLSDREREILTLLVQGDQNKVVARKLGISHRTVEVHRARIMHKTGADNFAELMKIAIISGLAD